MKKIFILLILIVIIVVGIFILNYKNFEKQKIDIENFNFGYEKYNKANLNGLDVTTLINKAISNNEKYAISKNEEGLYILDDENSIEIYITMIIDGKTYRMESINKKGTTSFASYFGQVNFKCTDITYHKNGKIASMTFEATEY